MPFSGVQQFTDGHHFLILDVVDWGVTQGHHEYLNHYGQPEAHLIWTHSVGERRRDLKDSPFMTGLVVKVVLK